MGRYTWVAGLVLCAGLADRQTAAGQTPGQPVATSDQSPPAIVLHVINYAALSRNVLEETMARVARVYNAIGVRTVWVEGERSADERKNGSLHLTILLLSRDMASTKISSEGIQDGVFGQAHLPSGRASIFCERISTVPGAPTYLPIPLGDVIAHEVGHLVMGTNSHSPTGIMRAHANVRAMHVQTFDEAQALTIRTTLMKVSNP